MVNQLGFAKRFLLLVTPIATSSALAPLALSIAASPSLAATLASSEARFDIDKFSHNLLKTETFTDTDTFTDATSRQATAEAEAFAEFIQLPPSASNSSFSTTNGDGSNYFGQAESLAAVIGYNFLVREGETFSFDFKGSLNLKTSIDDSQTESASAAGDLSLVLIDNTDQVVLDFFTLSGALTTPGDGDDDFLSPDKSANITLIPSGTSFDTSFGGKQEFVKSSVQGKFSRTFNSLTSLTLVEAKSNQANVAAVPEPSTILASLFFCLAGLGYKMRSKVFGAKPNISQ